MVVYEFEVTSVTPSKGSLYGGTDITINGNGFHNESKVHIGETNCVKREIRPHQIICDMESTELIYNISNQGIHPSRSSIWYICPFESLFCNMHRC